MGVWLLLGGGATFSGCDSAEQANAPQRSELDAAELEGHAAKFDEVEEESVVAADRSFEDAEQASTPRPAAAPMPQEKSELPVSGKSRAGIIGPAKGRKKRIALGDGSDPLAGIGAGQPMPTPSAGEGYDRIEENEFVAVADDPRSTFSIDVDTASYANVRRFLEGGSMPPADAVRIEEMINYFGYDYESPIGRDPFSINTEVSGTPWNPDTLLVSIGLQGQRIDMSEVGPRNLVFLLDVSGSMNDPDKLPLLKQGLGMLVSNLRNDDRVSIVVYAGASGVVLEPTMGSDKPRIMEALARLEAGGSTNGGEGIELAYAMASRHFEQGGVNRVILATDGDFNVGVTSRSALVELIEAKRRSGVFLSVLGFGTGNMQDSTMEMLADKGNGNYAYIDSKAEARKVLVEEAGGTLVTIAKDVKLQVEFNPAEVENYRLIGYENRKLAHADFNDDTKDAGEIGAGHSVTALYEVTPKSGRSETATDELKYQGKGALTAAAASGELLTVKIRYKKPDGKESKLLSLPVTGDDRGLRNTSTDYRFAAAVAEFGMLLRGSKHAGSASYDQVLELARASVGEDPHGHRKAFLQLVDQAKRLRESSTFARKH